MKTVGELKAGVEGLLTGTTLANVVNANYALERAVRTMSQRIYVPEATGRQAVTVYSRVFDYAAPSTIFGGALVDFRPQGVSRSPLDEVYRQPIELFDQTKCLLGNGVAITFEYNKGTPIMRLSDTRATEAVVLDSMSSITGWTAGGSASTPVLDQTVYYEAPGALRFTLTGSSTGYIEKTQTSGVDLTDYRGVGVVFLAIDTPSASLLTNINLRLGSDSSNYYSVDATTGFLAAWPAGSYVLVAFDLSLATTVGSPAITAVDYSRLTFTHTGTLTNMRVGNLFVSLPSPYEIIYKSAAVFLVSGTLSTSITGDADQITLNDAAYNILEHEAALAVAFQEGGTAASGTMAELNKTLHGVRARNGMIVEMGLYDHYRIANPSEIIQTVGNWYD